MATFKSGEFRDFICITIRLNIPGDCTTYHLNYISYYVVILINFSMFARLYAVGGKEKTPGPT
jgi:hypothetical protein